MCDLRLRLKGEFVVSVDYRVLALFLPFPFLDLSHSTSTSHLHNPASHLFYITLTTTIHHLIFPPNRDNMADVESSELSSLSSLSPAPSDDEGDVELKQDKGILKFFHKLPKGTKPTAPEREPTPPAPKRPPSPPHDYVLADNPDIAVREIVFFAQKTRNVALNYKLTCNMCSSSSCSAADSVTLCPNPWSTLDHKN